MLNVIICKGLPGSGKSTWAKKLIDDHPGQYKRINKDDLRAMLDNGKFSKQNEDFVLEIRNQILLMALQQGKHVIIDDTNLHPKHEAKIRELVKGIATVSIQDFTHISVETCIKRDLNRFASVGEKVIRDMYKQFLAPKLETYSFKEGLPNAVICDLDGTLCLLRNRNPYDASRCDQDDLNPVVASLLVGKIVLLVSGREEKYREPTVKFLTKYHIQYHALWMRETGDRRKDSIIKKEIFDRHIRDVYNIEFVLDDRNQVVELWRSLGLTCLQVADGDF
ncbi:MAG: AAA family ATPase [Snowella sp.]|nr:AAA family ATPase [Snowella sp.]